MSSRGLFDSNLIHGSAAPRGRHPDTWMAQRRKVGTSTRAAAVLLMPTSRLLFTVTHQHPPPLHFTGGAYVCQDFTQVIRPRQKGRAGADLPTAKSSRSAHRSKHNEKTVIFPLFGSKSQTPFAFTGSPAPDGVIPTIPEARGRRVPPNYSSRTSSPGGETGRS